MLILSIILYEHFVIHSLNFQVKLLVHICKINIAMNICPTSISPCSKKSKYIKMLSLQQFEKYTIIRIKVCNF